MDIDDNLCQTYRIIPDEPGQSQTSQASLKGAGPTSDELDQPQIWTSQASLRLERIRPVSDSNESGQSQIRTNPAIFRLGRIRTASLKQIRPDLHEPGQTLTSHTSLKRARPASHQPNQPRTDRDESGQTGTSQDRPGRVKTDWDESRENGTIPSRLG